MIYYIARNFMKPYYQDENTTIYLGDCREILPQLQTCDAVITDPPYNTGNFKWDDDVMNEVIPAITTLKPEFVVYFGQFPQITTWHLQAQNLKWRFLEHIVWVKRTASPNVRVQRGHESIFIYALGKNLHFYQSKGKWEDVKLPGYAHALLTIEGIDRYVKDLRAKANGKDTVKRFNSSSRNSEYNESRLKLNSTDRSPENADFSNVWSFLPQNIRVRNGQHDHPTIKPLQMMERLVEMLTKEAALIIDPFAGTGTTLIAARNLNRRIIGIEIEEKYCEIAAERLQRKTSLFSEAI